jgi:hypothetical protein
MTRRKLLSGVVAGAAGVIAGAATAMAERIRLLPAEGDVGPIKTGVISPEFQRFVATVRVGETRAHGTLLVCWLRGTTTAPPLAVATLEEARTSGDLVITERAQASVPSLIVENRGKLHALLLAGEILIGGKQHRVVTEDILLPPLSGPLNITVYCVEQGRWRGTVDHFESKGSFAAPGLRARVMERADQGQVWAEVNKYTARAAAPSSTGSYQAIYDKPEVREHQQDVERTLDLRSAPGAQGAAVFVAGSLVGVDLFQDAGLFARQWPKLLRAHALEAYGRRAEGDGPERDPRRAVSSLLQRLSRTEGTLRSNAGAGRLFEFRVDRFRGSALVAEGQVVHAACL